ncbi:hypothetical protein [Methylobacterium brachiatum]|uniref:hypothetical protein n=1 Tax=Methylobacterium brachiatum TaxID=269660 RepID=UPI002449CDEE|nr:hypothetical protein [Methylobacterium brachiatum]MDH2314002.1 hypothetical protein [Methylobacterium brachiatum]
MVLFRDQNHLFDELVGKPPRDFVSHYLFEPIPFIFRGDLAAWINWKTILSSKLEVDPRNIVLTGSAAIGFSLSPMKGYRPFSGRSDVDCGIISEFHFDLAWRHLRQSAAVSSSISGDVRKAVNSHKVNHIFTGTIAANKILPILPFGQTWMAALTDMSQIEPTVGRDVKLRIYKDFDALRFYQSDNIGRLRDALAAERYGSTEIAVED